MTQQPEKKNPLDKITDSAGRGSKKKDKKDVFAKTKTKLNPESLEAREMMSVNPLDGDWFQTNDFVKYDLSESRASAMASVIADAGDLSEGGVLDVPNEWLIQLSEDFTSRITNVDEATRYFQSLGITVVEGLGTRGTLHVVVNGGGTTADQSLKLSSIVGITGFEPNRMLVSAATNIQDAVNDPNASRLWNLNIGNVADAWDYVPSNTSGTGEVIVAVLDSGVNINHPDLKANIWVNTAEKSGTAGADDDKNGFKDDFYGWNFYNNNNDILDNHGHGTHVAGTIAATANNSIGVTGVAPNAKILPLKFLNSSGNGFSSDATKAINYTTALKLAGNNIVAINCSFGSAGTSTTMQTAIIKAGDAGIVVVAAAGNETYNLDKTNIYPAGIEAPNLITVGATTETDAWASYSNYGSCVEVAAPGSGIYSTTIEGGYGYMSGTSMATPFVSGIVALAASANPNLSPEQIKAAIIDGVDVLPGLNGKVSSSGRVNAAKTLALATGNTPKIEAPATPNGLIAKMASSSQVYVAWDFTLNATSYKVEAQAAGSDTWTTVYTGNSTSFTNTGLSAGTQYTYRVSAINSAGESAVSKTVSATTAKVGESLTAPPTNLTWTAKAGNSMTFQWDAMPNALSYTVQYYSDSLGYWATANGGENITATTFSGNWSSTTDYLLRVCATTPAGQTEFAVVSFTRSVADFKIDFGSVTPAPVESVPSSPTGLTATAASTSQINVKWNSQSGATSYKLEVQAAGSNTWTTVYTGNSTSFTNTGLSAGTQYTYRVSAINSVGESAVSSTVSATTTKAVESATTAPTNLTWTAKAGNRMTFQWDAVPNAVSYTVQYYSDSLGYWATASGAESITSTTYSGNWSSTTDYLLRVCATTSTGQTEFAVVSFTRSVADFAIV